MLYFYKGLMSFRDSGTDFVAFVHMSIILQA